MGLFTRLIDAVLGNVRLELSLPDEIGPGAPLVGAVVLTAGEAGLRCDALTVVVIDGRGRSITHLLDSAAGVELPPGGSMSIALEIALPRGFSGVGIVRALADIPGLPDPSAEGQVTLLADPSAPGVGDLLEQAATAAAGLERVTAIRSRVSFGIVPFEAGLDVGECFDAGALYSLLLAAERAAPTVDGGADEVALSERFLSIHLDARRVFEDLCAGAGDAAWALHDALSALSADDLVVYALEGAGAHGRVIDRVVAVAVDAERVALAWWCEAHPPEADEGPGYALIADVGDDRRGVVFCGGGAVALPYAVAPADDPGVVAHRVEVFFVDPQDPSARVVASDVRWAAGAAAEPVQLSPSWADDALVWGVDELPEDGETGWYAQHTTLYADGTERRGAASRVIAAVADEVDPTGLAPTDRATAIAEAVRVLAAVWADGPAFELGDGAGPIPVDAEDPEAAFHALCDRVAAFEAEASWAREAPRAGAGCGFALTGLLRGADGEAPGARTAGGLSVFVPLADDQWMRLSVSG